jgi:hypothetical protein
VQYHGDYDEWVMNNERWLIDSAVVLASIVSQIVAGACLSLLVVI